MKSAYTTLTDMVQRSKKNAVDIPKQNNIRTYWSGIGFKLGGCQYVSPIPEIAEILPVPKFTQVPGVKHWVKGVANVRGKLLPIMDLSGFVFETTSQQKARRKRVLIVDSGELYSGIIVDEILGMQHFKKSHYSEQVAHDVVDSAIMPYLAGQYSRDDSVWPVFSPLQLAEDPKFLRAAS